MRTTKTCIRAVITNTTTLFWLQVAILNGKIRLLVLDSTVYFAYFLGPYHHDKIGSIKMNRWCSISTKKHKYIYWILRRIWCDFKMGIIGIEMMIGLSNEVRRFWILSSRFDHSPMKNEKITYFWWLRTVRFWSNAVQLEVPFHSVMPVLGISYSKVGYLDGTNQPFNNWGSYYQISGQVLTLITSLNHFVPRMQT